MLIVFAHDGMWRLAAIGENFRLQCGHAMNPAASLRPPPPLPSSPASSSPPLQLVRLGRPPFWPRRMFWNSRCSWRHFPPVLVLRRPLAAAAALAFAGDVGVKMSIPFPRCAAESNVRRRAPDVRWQIRTCLVMRSGANERPQHPHGIKPLFDPAAANSSGGGGLLARCGAPVEAKGLSPSSPFDAATPILGWPPDSLASTSPAAELLPSCPRVLPASCCLLRRSAARCSRMFVRVRFLLAGQQPMWVESSYCG